MSDETKKSLELAQEVVNRVQKPPALPDNPKLKELEDRVEILKKSLDNVPRP